MEIKFFWNSKIFGEIFSCLDDKPHDTEWFQLLQKNFE